MRDMDKPIETLAVRDRNHRCPICGGETELVRPSRIGTVTHWDGEKHQTEVTSRRRRYAVLDCRGHSDGLNEPPDG
jgi:transposase